MNSVVQITDQWRPHITHSIPFSNLPAYKAKQFRQPKLRSTRKDQTTTNLPILAVTRHEELKIESSCRSSVVNQKLEHLTNLIHSSKTNKRVTKSPKTISRPAPIEEKSETPPEESADTFNVRNINNSIVQKPVSENTENNEVKSTPSSRPQSDVRRPAKFSAKPDSSRYFSAGNGVWKTRTITPGELELKKHNDWSNYHDEKSINYKFSSRAMSGIVPMYDLHDPDVMNLTTVTEFLQKTVKKVTIADDVTDSGHRSPAIHQIGDGAHTDRTHVTAQSPFLRIDERANTERNGKLTRENSNKRQLNVNLYQRRTNVLRAKKPTDKDKTRGSENSRVDLRTFRLHRFLTSQNDTTPVIENTHSPESHRVDGNAWLPGSEYEKYGRREGSSSQSHSVVLPPSIDFQRKTSSAKKLHDRKPLSAHKSQYRVTRGWMGLQAEARHCNSPIVEDCDDRNVIVMPFVNYIPDDDYINRSDNEPIYSHVNTRMDSARSQHSSTNAQHTPRSGMWTTRSYRNIPKSTPIVQNDTKSSNPKKNSSTRCVKLTMRRGQNANMSYLTDLEDRTGD